MDIIEALHNEESKLQRHSSSARLLRPPVPIAANSSFPLKLRLSARRCVIITLAFSIFPDEHSTISATFLVHIE